MSESLWYYAQGSERLGPIDRDDLSAMFDSGQIPLSTLVWTKGMPDWTPATLVAQFNPSAGTLPPRSDPTQRDPLTTLIPYRNSPALTAYYLGVFSIIPFFPIALGAFVLGILGLRKRAREPQIGGAVHAWIGIVLGFIFTLLWGGATAFLLYTFITNA